MPPYPLPALILCLLVGLGLNLGLEHLDRTDSGMDRPNLQRVEARVTRITRTEHLMDSPRKFEGTYSEIHHAVHYRYTDLKGNERDAVTILRHRPENHSAPQIATLDALDRAQRGNLALHLDPADPGFRKPAYLRDSRTTPRAKDDATYIRVVSSVAYGLFLFFLYAMASYVKRELFSGYDPNRLD